MTTQDDRLTPAEERALARQYTLEAYETLLEIVRMPDASPTVRDQALRSLIARGWVAPEARPDDPAKLQ